MTNQYPVYILHNEFGRSLRKEKPPRKAVHQATTFSRGCVKTLNWNLRWRISDNLPLSWRRCGVVYLLSVLFSALSVALSQLTQILLSFHTPSAVEEILVWDTGLSLFVDAT